MIRAIDMKNVPMNFLNMYQSIFFGARNISLD